MNRLYLVRHGENRANLTKEFSSRLVDYPLTAKGVLQAQQTADYFQQRAGAGGIDAVYSSPLKRSRSWRISAR
jgi:broad specificity phosphatase PhoE